METATQIPHPPIATREEWLAKRKDLLADEKAHTREYDRINAKRRRLPMVKVEKNYTLEGVDGQKTLRELFGEKNQLIIYHFMFDPDWEKGCPGCTGFIDALGDLSTLAERDTAFVVVSRAPLAKLVAYKEAHGWNIEWYSSFGSDFNYDFHATMDESRAPIEYNYKTKEDLAAQGLNHALKGEQPATSVFFRIGDDVFLTYQCFARGGEALTDSYRLLDITPYGRQEDFEDSPEGWPQKPTYG